MKNMFVAGYQVLFSNHALVAGKETCSHRVKYNYGEVNYESGNYYFKLPKNFDLYDFLKENMVAGKLKEPALLKISGKKVKLYQKYEQKDQEVKLAEPLRL